MWLGTRDGRVRLEILPYGLTIHRIEVRVGEHVHDIVAGPENADEHRTLGRRFYGPIIGRYANRLPAGCQVYWDRAKKEHLMIELPAWGGQNVSHHGGPCTEASLTNTGSSLLQHGPFDCAMWTQIRESSMYSDKDYDAWDESACFALESPVGDQGYPGHVRVEAFVGVQSSGAPSAMELGRIHVEYRARLVDDATTATPLNLTQHWGFNLGASSVAHRGTGVDGHALQLGGGVRPLYRLVLDTDGIPTGALESCAGTRYDWSRPNQQIRADTDYDHFYVWGASTAANNSETAGRRNAIDRNPVMATLSGPTGLTLRFRTNQTGVQMFVPPNACKEGARKVRHRIEPTKPELDGRHHAIFLEFSAPHATFLRPTLWDWAGHDTLLRQGETYQSVVTVELSQQVL